MPVTLGPAPPEEIISAPQPVTVHWEVGGRWPPYSRGILYWRSAVEKCELVTAMAFDAKPELTAIEARASVSAIVEQAPYTPK